MLGKKRKKNDTDDNLNEAKRRNIASEMLPLATGTNDIIDKLFKPLLREDGPSIGQDNFQELKEKFNDFYTNYTGARYNDTSYPKRNNLGKGLGRFTIEALSKIKSEAQPFKGIRVVRNLTTTDGRPARGLFTPSTNTINLNSDVIDQDLLSTIVHEGNHALEYNNPDSQTKSGNIVKNFLKKEVGKREDKKLPVGYLSEVYKGIQDILNLGDFSRLYHLDPEQSEEITEVALESPLNPWGNKFDEVPAFALESLVQQYPNQGTHEWNINLKTTNEDSRRLLKRILKETHRQYMKQGLVNTAADPQTYVGQKAAYGYKGIPVPNYPAPELTPNYGVVSQVLIDKINSLRKPSKGEYNYTIQDSDINKIISDLQPFESFSSVGNQSPLFGGSSQGTGQPSPFASFSSVENRSPLFGGSSQGTGQSSPLASFSSSENRLTQQQRRNPFAQENDPDDSPNQPYNDIFGNHREKKKRS